MSLIRWDEESRVRVVLGLVALGVGTWLISTTERTAYMHLAAVFLIVLAVWSMLLAVVPDLRGKSGTPHRALIVGATYAVVIVAFLILGRLAVSP